MRVVVVVVMAAIPVETLAGTRKTKARLWLLSSLVLPALCVQNAMLAR
jgi:hypothetical protein